MKLPRNVSGASLQASLRGLGYETVRQRGSHVRITTQVNGRMINSLKPYPAMKDSGVEWLRDVPEHWDTSKIKGLARPGYKTFVDGDWIESPYITTDGIRLIQTGNIGTGEYREKGFRYISEETFTNFCCTEIKPGDILICRLGEAGLKGVPCSPVRQTDDHIR